MTASTTSASMDTGGAPLTSAVKNGTGLGEGHQSGISVTGHARADMLLIKPTGGPGRCRQPSGQVECKARRNGQITRESRQVTGPSLAAGAAAQRVASAEVVAGFA